MSGKNDADVSPPQWFTAYMDEFMSNATENLLKSVDASLEDHDQRCPFKEKFLILQKSFHDLQAGLSNDISKYLHLSLTPPQSPRVQSLTLDSAERDSGSGSGKALCCHQHDGNNETSSRVSKSSSSEEIDQKATKIQKPSMESSSYGQNSSSKSSETKVELNNASSGTSGLPGLDQIDRRDEDVSNNIGDQCQKEEAADEKFARNSETVETAPESSQHLISPNELEEIQNQDVAEDYKALENVDVRNVSQKNQSDAANEHLDDTILFEDSEEFLESPKLIRRVNEEHDTNRIENLKSSFDAQNVSENVKCEFQIMSETSEDVNVKNESAEDLDGKHDIRMQLEENHDPDARDVTNAAEDNNEDEDEKIGVAMGIPENRISSTTFVIEDQIKNDNSDDGGSVNANQKEEPEEVEDERVLVKIQMKKNRDQEYEDVSNEIENGNKIKKRKIDVNPEFPENQFFSKILMIEKRIESGNLDMDESPKKERSNDNQGNVPDELENEELSAGILSKEIDDQEHKEVSVHLENETRNEEGRFELTPEISAMQISPETSMTEDRISHEVRNEENSEGIDDKRDSGESRKSMEMEKTHRSEHQEASDHLKNETENEVGKINITLKTFAMPIPSETLMTHDENTTVTRNEENSDDIDGRRDLEELQMKESLCSEHEESPSQLDNDNNEQREEIDHAPAIAEDEISPETLETGNRIETENLKEEKAEHDFSNANLAKESEEKNYTKIRIKKIRYPEQEEVSDELKNGNQNKKRKIGNCETGTLIVGDEIETEKSDEEENQNVNTVEEIELTDLNDTNCDTGMQVKEIEDPGHEEISTVVEVEINKEEKRNGSDPEIPENEIAPKLLTKEDSIGTENSEEDENQDEDCMKADVVEYESNETKDERLHHENSDTFKGENENREETIGPAPKTSKEISITEDSFKNENSPEDENDDRSLSDTLVIRAEDRIGTHVGISDNTEVRNPSEKFEVRDEEKRCDGNKSKNAPAKYDVGRNSSEENMELFKNHNVIGMTKIEDKEDHEKEADDVYQRVMLEIEMKQKEDVFGFNVNGSIPVLGKTKLDLRRKEQFPESSPNLILPKVIEIENPEIKADRSFINKFHGLLDRFIEDFDYSPITLNLEIERLKTLKKTIAVEIVNLYLAKCRKSPIHSFCLVASLKNFSAIHSRLFDVRSMIFEYCTEELTKKTLDDISAVRLVIFLFWRGLLELRFIHKYIQYFFSRGDATAAANICELVVLFEWTEFIKTDYFYRLKIIVDHGNLQANVIAKINGVLNEKKRFYKR